MNGHRNEGEYEIEDEYEPGRSSEVKISAVHYVKFKLSPEAVEELADDGRPVSLLVEHLDYRHETPLADAVRASLVEDLRSG